MIWIPAYLKIFVQYVLFQNSVYTVGNYNISICSLYECILLYRIVYICIHIHTVCKHMTVVKIKERCLDKVLNKHDCLVFILPGNQNTGANQIREIVEGPPSGHGRKYS